MPHPPAVVPQVGQQLGQRAPVGALGGRRRRGRGRGGQGVACLCMGFRIPWASVRAAASGDSGLHEGRHRHVPIVAAPQPPGGSHACKTRNPHRRPTANPATSRRWRRPPCPTARQLVLRVMPLPADVNANGDIFGGWIMAQVDLAGAVLPSRLAKGRIATVAVNQFVFKQPVSAGRPAQLLRPHHAHRQHLDHRARRGLRRAQPRQPAGGQGDRGRPDLRGHRRPRPAAAGAALKPAPTAGSGAATPGRPPAASP